MSLFEKAIVPQLENVRKEDLSKECGFIDCFTEDPDKPTSINEFFLVFDDRVHNEKTIELSRRYAAAKNIRACYVKTVDAVPYRIYSFYLPPEIRKLYRPILCLNTKDKYNIFMFWGWEDKDVDKMMSNTCGLIDIKHALPACDYEEPDYLLTLNRTKKEGGN